MAHAPKPQGGDVFKALTRALVLAAETPHIRVVDHVTVTTDNVFSLREEGLL